MRTEPLAPVEAVIAAPEEEPPQITPLRMVQHPAHFAGTALEIGESITLYKKRKAGTARLPTGRTRGAQPSGTA